MRIADIPANKREEWNKKYVRFKRAWIKKNKPQQINVIKILEDFCDKHGFEK